MTNPIAGELNELEPSEVNRPTKPRLRGVVLITGAACVVICFIGSFIYDEVRLRNAKTSHEKYFAELRQLSEARTRLELAEKQAKKDRTVALDILRQVRKVEDIPDFQNSRLVTYSNGSSLSGYLPPGKHELIVTAQLKPAAPQQPVTSAVTKKTAKTYKGELSWTIPVTGGNGFRFRINRTESYRKPEGGPVTWALDCNQGDFQQRKETIPINAFAGFGWSMSGNTKLIVVPNQTSNAYAIRNLKTVTKVPTRIFQVKLHGKSNDIRHTIEFKIHVQSDGPVCVRAADAARLIQLGRRDLLMPYKGGGVYQLRTDTPANR